MLDLIFEAEVPPVNAEAIAEFMARHPKLGNPEALRKEAADLVAAYEKYASVSVAPCTLGVPDGFDVRLQMMEFDGLDPERCVLIGYWPKAILNAGCL